jgi:lipopolysaccharide biosynthesis regulator YciM
MTATIVIGACLIALSLLAGWIFGRQSSDSGPANGADVEVLSALDHVIEGNLSAAFDLLSTAAKERDCPPEVYFALASLLRSLGRLERSAHVYKTILARPGLDKAMGNRAQVGLARVFVELGRASEAREIIDLLPKKLRAQSGLLELQKAVAVQRGDWKAALATSEALAKAHGDNGAADVHARIAEDAAEEGDADAALKGFQKALRLEPGSIRASQGLARLYAQKGKTSKARRYLIATLQSNPALAPILLPRIKATWIHDRRNGEAKFEDLLSQLKEHPEIYLWIQLEEADRLYREGALDKCRELLEDLARRYPRSVEAHEAYLNLLIELDDERLLHRQIERFVDFAAAEIRRFRCNRCGFLSATPFMSCPHCADVGTMIYEG